jgi:predicted transcriptional regulator
MKKNVYSLVLSEHVVQAIDELAARQGTSRSNLINQILAEHVSCITPEKRMQSIFAVLEAQMQQVFRIQMQASDAMLSMQRVLPYKYRPTLRYRVELLREPTATQLGWLQISCRTQSKPLLAAMDDFFRFWIGLELQMHPAYQNIAGMYEIAAGRLTRQILRSRTQDTETAGDEISQYIHTFDRWIQAYFSGLQQGEAPQVLQQRLAAHVLAQQGTTQ